MATGIPARLTPGEGRKFAFPVGLAFLALGALTWWRGHETLRTIFGVVGLLLLVAGALVPGRLGPVYRAWMGLAHAISKVTTPIFMGVVFFAVITPIGLLMRAFGRRGLVHPERNGGFWMAPASGGRSDMERQF